MNAALQAEGLTTWFDDQKMRGNINDQMADGIDSTDVVLVFITSRYLAKVSGRGEHGPNDNSKFEFDYALNRKGVERMLPIVMESRCRNPKTWQGVVGGKLGGKMYVDCVEDDTTSFKAAIDAIVREVTFVQAALFAASHANANDAPSPSPLHPMPVFRSDVSAPTSVSASASIENISSPPLVSRSASDPNRTMPVGSVDHMSGSVSERGCARPYPHVERCTQAWRDHKRVEMHGTRTLVGHSSIPENGRIIVGMPPCAQPALPVGAGAPMGAECGHSGASTSTLEPAAAHVSPPKPPSKGDYGAAQAARTPSPPHCSISSPAPSSVASTESPSDQSSGRNSERSSGRSSERASFLGVMPPPIPPPAPPLVPPPIPPEEDSEGGTRRTTIAETLSYRLRHGLGTPKSALKRCTGLRGSSSSKESAAGRAQLSTSKQSVSFAPLPRISPRVDTTPIFATLSYDDDLESGSPPVNPSAGASSSAHHSAGRVPSKPRNPSPSLVLPSPGSAPPPQMAHRAGRPGSASSTKTQAPELMCSTVEWSEEQDDMLFLEPDQRTR